jgi:putative ABC transport system permease protein
MLFYLDDLARAQDMGIALVRVRGGAGGWGPIQAAMAEVWSEFNPYVPFEFTFLDQAYEKLYWRERQALLLFNVFAGLAVVISCLGLFGLAAFMAERRTKEIGVRKILGAGDWEIAALLTGDFARWVLAANVIAWPVGYFAAGKLLQAYAYRTEIGLGIFVAAGVSALAIALLTVARQAVRAARANPAISLRSE